MRLLVLGDFQGVFSGKLKRRLQREEFDLIVGVGDYGGIRDWRPWVMKNLEESSKGNDYLTAEEYFGKRRLKELVKKDEENTKKVLIGINDLGKEVIFVFGNGDDSWYKYPFIPNSPKIKKKFARFLSKLKNFNDITYGKRRFLGINFIGFGGYMDIDAYFDKKVFLEAGNKERFMVRMSRRIKSKINFLNRLKKIRGEKIFVFHYPPKGFFDIIKDKKDNPMNGKSSGIGFFTEAIKKYNPKIVLCGHMHEYQGAKKIHGSLIVNPGDAEKGRYAIVDISEDGKRRARVKFIK